MNNVSRWTVLKGSLVLGALIATGAALSANEWTRNAWTRAEPGTPDGQLDQILKALEFLPDELKYADPQTYPNYEQAIEPYLAGLTTIVHPAAGSGDTPDFDFWQCAGALGGFVAAVGFPVIKIIGWIQTALRLWKNVQGIVIAIRRGIVIRELGGEAAAVLGQLLGVGAIVKWCFN